MKEANKLSIKDTFKSMNSKAYIPKHFISVKGVISGVDVDFTIDDIKENIECTNLKMAIKYQSSEFVYLLHATKFHRT